MDNTVKNIVKTYVVTKYFQEHPDKPHAPDFSVYTVWKCKILQNWKYLLSTDLPDGMYYELTYNGDKAEWYLDAYKKYDNVCIPVEDLPKSPQDYKYEVTV